MKKKWIDFTSIVVLSFVMLIWVGAEIDQTQPQITEKVLIKNTNQVFYTIGEIQIVQKV